MNPNDVKILLTPASIVVQIKDKKKTFLKDNGDFSLVQYLILKEKWEDLEEVIHKKAAAEAMDVIIKNDTVVTKEGKPAHPTIATRITDGYQPNTLKAFKARCDANIWPEAIHDLLCFLKDKSLPLTPKGTFLAWKSITDDYLDHHSKTFDNHPGQKPKMKREECVSDRNNPCGAGFHAGTYSFAKGFATGRLILVEVDPAAVTSVPLDSSERKLRCDEYLVLEEFFGTNIDQEITIANLAEKIQGEDPEEFTTNLRKTNDRRKQQTTNINKTMPNEKAPTKKEVINYALKLKASKKGSGYTAKMVDNKYEGGLEVLEYAAGKRNPQKLSAETRSILQSIVDAS